MNSFGYHVDVNPIPIPYTIPDGWGNGLFAAKHSCRGGCIFRIFTTKRITMRTTPDRILELRPGSHSYSAATWRACTAEVLRLASLKFGAVWGRGRAAGRERHLHPHHAGRSGDDPSLCGRVHRFRPAASPDDVSRHGIGCGIAGFTPAEIAPLFEAAVGVGIPPARFWDVLSPVRRLSMARTCPRGRAVPRFCGGDWCRESVVSPPGGARAVRPELQGRIFGADSRSFSRINSYLSTDHSVLPQKTEPMKKLFLCMALGLAAEWALAAEPLWLRDVKISPDGQQIAFCYKGDIYKVAADGGKAVQLTTQESYESSPVWSPDGTRIAFASNREGGSDVYVMSSEGGPARRITFNSASEVPTAFSPDGNIVLS